MTATKGAWRWVVLVGLSIVSCSLVGSSLDEYTEGGGKGCPPGTEACGSVCVDLASNPDNCGKCGTVCVAPQVCDSAACADSCSGGKTDCDRACVNLDKDPKHCGSCDTFCSAAEACSNGTCATSCGAGETKCNSTCVDIQADGQHCGGCNQPCAIGQACSAGTCVASCGTDQTMCDGVCIDTQTNKLNCGSCGNGCDADQVCTGGKCGVGCPGVQSECDGLCYDLQSDNKHCGTCTNPCAVGEVCGNGECALVCPTGQSECSGSCVDLQTDSNHCGGCTTVCGANQECSAGECVIACKTLLNQSLADPWGWSWDGLERAASTWDQADATCKQIGGRLPTASELYRVSATQSATVGQTTHTNYLWANVPYSPANRVIVRLSDASTTSSAESTARNYRCVCPPPLGTTYTGKNCFGSTTGACFETGGQTNKYNLDLQDRAPLHKGGAVWECAFYRGHLATPLQLTEAIQAGVGGGSGNWLHTADEVHYPHDALVRWTDGSTFKFVYDSSPESVSWSTTTDFRPFRCIGLDTDPTPAPTVPDEFIGPTSNYKGEGTDRAASGLAAAVDTCFAAGGHLATSTELVELIQQGLPNGSGSWIWTSDQVGHDGTNFLMSVKRWTGVELSHYHAYSNDLSWDYKSSNYGFRCIYYPVDASYGGPSATQCNGGPCTEIALPVGSGKMWIDSFDRTPPVTATEAMAGCRAVGGHLASERDMTEAIRKGLPNGSTNALFTSDAEVASGGGVLLGVVYWSGVDTTYTDQWSTYSTWAWPYDPHAYRCMWTNELR